MKYKKRPLTKEHEHFIEKVCDGLSFYDAYMSVIETFRPDDKKSYATARGQASNWNKKFQKEIQERILHNYYAKKEERLDVMASTLAKQEELTTKTGLGEVAFTDESCSSVATLSKNPVLIAQTMMTGALTILFDTIEIGTNDKGKVELKKAIPNQFNWRHYDSLVKALFDNNSLSKEMFKAVAEKKSNGSPAVANQINVNLNQ